jgi:hypothetical protein
MRRGRGHPGPTADESEPDVNREDKVVVPVGERHALV